MKKDEFSPKELGHRIKMAREALHINQPELASLLDVSPRTVGSIEGGQSDLSVKNLYGIAIALKTTVAKLLKIEEGSITQSFNTIDIEQSHVIHGSRSKIEADLEWMQSINLRFEFMEELIKSLREENLRLKG